MRKMIIIPPTVVATASRIPPILPTPREASIASGIISKATTPAITPPAKLSTLPITRLPLFLSSAPITPPKPVPTTPAMSDNAKISQSIFASKKYIMPTGI